MYEKKASRRHPVLAAFVIDDSCSMEDCCFGSEDKKFMWTERYAGILLKWIVFLSTFQTQPSFRIWNGRLCEMIHRVRVC